MFSKREKRGRRAGSEPFTYIQEGTTIRGDLEASGRVRVHGTVLGNLTVAGVLEVAAEGKIHGDYVEAKQVRILGEVRAQITATGKVEIWSGGRLEGDVRAASLDIEEGASFTGRSEMRPAGVPALTDGSDRPRERAEEKTSAPERPGSNPVAGEADAARLDPQEGEKAEESEPGPLRASVQ